MQPTNSSGRPISTLNDGLFANNPSLGRMDSQEKTNSMGQQLHNNRPMMQSPEMNATNRSPSNANLGPPSGELLNMLQSTSSHLQGNTQPRMDMSEFPALASRVAGMSLNTPGPLPMNNLRFGGKHEEFVIQKEDFPALSSFGEKSKGHEISSTNDVMVQQGQSMGSSTSIGSKTQQENRKLDVQLDSSFPPLQVGATRPRGGSDPLAKESADDKYGLLGLLPIVRMSNKDLSSLALGMDLTSLGLNLNSAEPLYPTFMSPWADVPSTKEPQYNLPSCYYMQPPALKTSHLSKFQLETLFYIFYAMPQDILQAYAAQELYSREWRYHVELKLWFKQATPSDGLGNPGAQFIYFDINQWERRLFSGNIGGINVGLMSEEEVQVKFSGKTAP